MPHAIHLQRTQLDDGRVDAVQCRRVAIAQAELGEASRERGNFTARAASNRIVLDVERALHKVVHIEYATYREGRATREGVRVHASSNTQTRNDLNFRAGTSANPDAHPIRDM